MTTPVPGVSVRCYDIRYCMGDLPASQCTSFQPITQAVSGQVWAGLSSQNRYKWSCPASEGPVRDQWGRAGEPMGGQWGIQMVSCHLAVMKKFLCGRPAQFDWLVATYHISQARTYRPDRGGREGGLYRVITVWWLGRKYSVIFGYFTLFSLYFVPGVGEETGPVENNID